MRNDLQRYPTTDPLGADALVPAYDAAPTLYILRKRIAQTLYDRLRPKTDGEEACVDEISDAVLRVIIDAAGETP